MVDDEYPAHAVFDCATGELRFEPQTAEEIAEAQARAEAWRREQEQNAAGQEQIRALVDAHPDPLVKLLAQRAGLA